MENEFWATLTSITPIAKDTFEVAFSLGEEGFTFKSGQYIWVVLQQLSYPDPRGERRAFSVTSSNLSPSNITIQFRSSESGYKKTLLSLPVGTTVKVIGPFGSSYVLNSSQKKVVMIAGGVGIAPFLSIIRSMSKSEQVRQFVLVYINSSPEAGVFFDELQEKSKAYNFPFINHIGGFRENILPSGIDFARDTFFICGPVGMVDAVHMTLKSRGVPFDNMHFEQHYPSNPENLTEEHFKITPGTDMVMQRAIEDSKNHVIITDANGQIIFANKAAQEKTGYTFDEMRGNTPRLWGGMMDAEFYKAFWHKKMTETGFDGEIINRRKNGEHYHALTHISTIYGTSKNIIGYIGTEEDISALKKIQKDLQHQNEVIQEEKINDDAIVNSIGDSLIVTDKDGIVLRMNKNAEELTGYTIENCRGKLLTQVLPIIDMSGKEIALEDRPITEALNKKEKVSRDVIYMHPKRGKVIFNVTVTPVLLWGNVVGVIDVLRDTTKEREVDREKTDFISLASHQLRTPLTAINWSCEMLLSGDFGEVRPKQKEYIDEVYNGSQRMVKLVSALLNVSRIEAGTFLVDPEPVEIIKLVHVVLDESKKKIEEKHLVVHLENDEIPVIQLDPNLTTIILQNLLTNSIKYTPAGGVIDISLKKYPKGTAVSDISLAEDSLLIEVKDSGIGIPKAHQKDVFTKLFRADNARACDQDGSGLGLYLVKSLIEHAGGHIWFISEENKGTTFFVVIPLSGMVKKEGSKALDR